MICVATLFLLICAQNENLSKEEKRARKEMRKKEREQVEKTLNVYTICPSTETEFVIAAVRPADKDVSKTLGRETAEGVKGVSHTDSHEILITFKDGMRFANLRPDRSEPSKYEEDKKVAIEHLEYINSTRKSMSTSKPIEKVYNGFSTYSIIALS